MRRTLTLSIVAALSLAACGTSDSADGNGPTTAVSAPSSELPPVDSAPAEGAAPESLPADTSVAPTNPDKPTVETPADLPSELVRTVLQPGIGAEAVDGDTVIVDYVGVRSTDGVEFDNSYDRGEPFPVVLGSGGVIAGWEEGLIGAQAGERVQLDIPPDLAYGAEPRGDVIGANETLTFVIDVRAVVPPADPADAPTEPGVELSIGEGVPDTTFEDLTVGDGATLETGQTAVIRYVNFRGDNAVAIETNWSSDPLQVPYGEGLLPGLVEGMDGMKVGGRRAITIPPEDGFGPDGNPQGGLPADTDMIFVIELVGVYGTATETQR